MTDTYLLDTHTAIWITEGGALSSAALAVLENARLGAAFLKISPITAWEVGLLTAKNRLSLSAKPSVWFESLCRLPEIDLAELDGSILIDSSFLPGKAQGDPADRIIIATARANGLTILTRDRQILTYAQQGHVLALKC